MRTVIVIGISLALLAAYAYFYHRETLLGLADGHLPSTPRSQASLYKWQDSAGAWHYTDAPPPAGTSSERVEVRGDVNVMPALKEEQQR
jgi:hypothetical protein